MRYLDLIVGCTVRIVTDKMISVGTGTGFFYQFRVGDHDVPVIMTNKHVVDGAKTIDLRFTLQKDNRPLYGNYYDYHTQTADHHIMHHPNPEIDLVAMPLGPIIDAAHLESKELYFVQLREIDLLKHNNINDVKVGDELLMVGYPNGLWDEHNNLPITRRGALAIPYFADFNGKKEFVIDAACFPGSSGSPIFLHSMSPEEQEDGSYTPGRIRRALLGVLYQGPQQLETGDIVHVPVPTAVKPIAVIQRMINIGYCIKAEQIRGFQTPLEQYFADHPV